MFSDQSKKNKIIGGITVGARDVIKFSNPN